MLRAQLNRARLFDIIEKNKHHQFEIDGLSDGFLRAIKKEFNDLKTIPLTASQEVGRWQGPSLIILKQALEIILHQHQKIFIHQLDDFSYFLIKNIIEASGRDAREAIIYPNICSQTLKSQEVKLEPELEDMPLLRLLSVATTGSQTSEIDRDTLLCSPSASPYAEPCVMSVELSRLQDQLSECQKELEEASKTKGWRQKELASATHSIHSSFAALLNEKILVPQFWLDIKEEVKPADDEASAGPIILPSAPVLAREDTFGVLLANLRGKDKPEKFHRPLKITTANPDEKVRYKKVEILNKLTKKQNITRLLQSSEMHIEDLTTKIEETEANIFCEKSQIIDIQNASRTTSPYSFYQPSVLVLTEEDGHEFKRQRCNGPA